MTLQAVRARWRPAAALVVVVVLTAATVYEAAQALGVISLGKLPGDDAPGAGIVETAAPFAFLTAFVVGFCSFRDAERIPSIVRQLLPLVAVAAAVVGYFSFDPYFAPTKRRYSDYASSGQTVWICFVIAVALTAGVVARYRPRAGMLLTLVALFLCIPTAFLGAFH